MKLLNVLSTICFIALSANALKFSGKNDPDTKFNVLSQTHKHAEEQAFQSSKDAAIAEARQRLRKNNSDPEEAFTKMNQLSDLDVNSVLWTTF